MHQEIHMVKNETVCDKILQIDPRIRFAGMISDKGRLELGKQEAVDKFLADKKQYEMYFMGCALTMRMSNEFDESLGPVNFTITHRKNEVTMTFPLGKQVLLISCDNEGPDLINIPYKVLQTLGHSTESGLQEKIITN
jgi:uncharacterized protein DUF6659